VIIVADESTGSSTPLNVHRHDHVTKVYDEMHDSADFQELRKRYRSFALPWTVAFLVWYMLYVIMSNWATDFMNIRIAGNINVALVFGLLQFVSTFVIAWLYAKRANRDFDPLAAKLEAHYEAEVGRTTPVPGVNE
jgi:uncharacterized membrane protein (DUF485 family)